MLRYVICIGFCIALGVSIASNLQDPTRPINYKGSPIVAKPVAGVTLSSIFVSSHRRVAVINNTVVSEGDRIREFTVKTISPNAVILENGQGKLVTLQLLQHKIKGQ